MNTQRPVDIQALAAVEAASLPPALSLRQAEIVELISQGLQNKQIAHRLRISDATVKAHVAKAMVATGCRNRVTLALFWLRHTGRLIP
jgi:DNA-binding NarL/FixJ family response regulator